MPISHEVGPERAAELIQIVLGELDTEHPAWLELSLLSEQIGKLAKRVAASKRKRDREVEALERHIARKLERLRAGFVFYDEALSLASNEWTGNDLKEVLTTAATDVIFKIKDEVFSDGHY